MLGLAVDALLNVIREFVETTELGREGAKCGDGDN